MAKYNLSNPLDLARFRKRTEKLIASEALVELSDETKRTLSQNNYLYVLLTAFALEIGESVEYVKRVHFKKMCNPDIFVVEKVDKVTGEVTEDYLSTAIVGKEKTSKAIERFLNYASKHRIYLPECGDTAVLQEIAARYSEMNY